MSERQVHPDLISQTHATQCKLFTGSILYPRVLVTQRTLQQIFENHNTIYHNLLPLLFRRTANYSLRILLPSPTVFYCLTTMPMLVIKTLFLSSPRAGLHAESARAFTGRRNSHSGRGEDFLTGQLNFFTETVVTPERKVEKSFPRWEINCHAEG